MQAAIVAYLKKSPSTHHSQNTLPQYPNTLPYVVWHCFFNAEEMIFLDTADMHSIVFAMFSQYSVNIE